MNERIKELAEQSLPNVKFWNEEITKGNTPPNSRAITLNELEKFARMIVLECEKVAKDPKWYGESPSNGWRNPIRHVCTVMKEHFGVEE